MNLMDLAGKCFPDIDFIFAEFVWKKGVGISVWLSKNCFFTSQNPLVSSVGPFETAIQQIFFCCRNLLTMAGKID